MSPPPERDDSSAKIDAARPHVPGRGLAARRARIRCLAAGVGGALAGAVLVAHVPQAPRFSAAANVVVVEATVLDRQDAVVAGLSGADFAIEIDGQPREIV